MLRTAKNSMLSLLATLLFQNCSSLKQEEDPYQAIWEKRLDSEAWKESLTTSPETGQTMRKPHYALPGLDQIRSEEVSPAFLETYPKLVSRAYFRLIAEALEADRDIRKEYQRASTELNKAENTGDSRVQSRFETSRKRYIAHRQMLEGLRSWRSFQKYGSDDLEFFLEEQLKTCFALYEKGASEERMVGHLMTALADLYHKDEGSSFKSL